MSVISVNLHYDLKKQIQLLNYFIDEQAETEKNNIPCQEHVDGKFWFQDSYTLTQTPWPVSP